MAAIGNGKYIQDAAKSIGQIPKLAARMIRAWEVVRGSISPLDVYLLDLRRKQFVTKSFALIHICSLSFSSPKEAL